MKLRSAPFAAAVAGFCLAGTTAWAQDCVAVMSQRPELSTLIGVLGRTGQADLLRSVGPFTILAPTNEAISRLPVNLRTDLVGSQPTQDIDPIRAPAVVNAHIIDGRHPASEVRGRDRVTFRTRNGNELIVQRGGDGTYMLTAGAGGFGAGGRYPMEPARVVQADIPCSNGVVHIVDSVLVR
jgi:uncharacterized surface protein with fasciclin (FAS1) repeats